MKYVFYKESVLLIPINTRSAEMIFSIIVGVGDFIFYF